MALPQTFKAMVVSETAEKTFSREVRERALGDLPAGELIIEVKYSSLNYKDALSATGNKGVTRKYPHTPGIDAAGVVADSTTKLFTVGDQVTVTGFDLGMNTSGGFARYISVPALWATKLPQGLSLKDSMSHGTAGLTAALCIIRLMASGLTKESGEVLVTGASGGVGSVAVAILAKLGFNVVAATGKASEHDFLSGLGAKAIISREEANDTSGRPLQKPRWAGVVDTVGGNILATALKTTKYGWPGRRLRQRHVRRAQRQRFPIHLARCQSARRRLGRDSHARAADGVEQARRRVEYRCGQPCNRGFA